MGICSIQGIILWAAVLLGSSCIAGNGQGMWITEKTAGRQAVQDSVSQTDLEVEVRDGFAYVQIQSGEEYRAFIDWLNGPSGETVRHLDLALEETDTDVYLDEILEGNSLWGLSVSDGGNISVKDTKILEKCSLTSLELYHVSMLDMDAVNGIQGLKYITIRLDDRYRGIMPTEELLGNRECWSVVLLWDGEADTQGLAGDGEHPFEQQKGKDILISAAEENERLNGIYRQNEDNYSFTSYEFFRGDAMSAVFLAVEDRESGGEGYFDMLRVPQERLPDINENIEPRMELMDLNFDGHEDLIFFGENAPGDWGQECIIYLWEESTGKFVFCETAPRYFESVEPERERLTRSFRSRSQNEYYYIYEYHEGVFRETRMEVKYTDYGDVVWAYYEDGELLERLYLLAGKDERYYVYLDRDGNMEVSEVPDDVQYNEVGEKFFPEFDFYCLG